MRRNEPRRSEESLVRAERAVLLGGIATITTLSWLYVIPTAGKAAGRPAALTSDLPVIAPMWVAMMIGMMVPTTGPMVLRYAAVSRRIRGGHIARVFAFVLTYLGLWSVVSVVGAAIQLILRAAGLVTDLGGSASTALSASVLAVAGAYQLSPLKRACLRRCRSPLAFLVAEWRPGLVGALRLGVRHGVECVLCCWALMALVFVVGAMNLLWMAGLMLVMVAEKALPAGERMTTVVGLALIAWAAFLLGRAFWA